MCFVFHMKVMMVVTVKVITMIVEHIKIHKGAHIKTHKNTA